MSNLKDEKWLSDLGQKLQQFEANPPAGAWEAISQKMMGESAPSAATRGVSSATKIVAALSLIISIAIIFWFMRKPTPSPLEKTDIIKNPSTTDIIPLNNQIGNNAKKPAIINAEEVPLKKEVIVSSKTTISPISATTENMEETKVIVTEVLPRQLEISTSSPDTVRKIITKPGSFYERMRTDSTLKKQQLFK